MRSLSLKRGLKIYLLLQSMADDTIIICTPDELLRMHSRGEVGETGFCITLEALFEVLCECYGVNPHWNPTDVY